jgi:hypothetical protein
MTVQFLTPYSIPRYNHDIFCSADFEGVDVVFHTAAADPSTNNIQLHYKVNLEG